MDTRITAKWLKRIGRRVCRGHDVFVSNSVTIHQLQLKLQRTRIIFLFCFERKKIQQSE